MRSCRPNERPSEKLSTVLECWSSEVKRTVLTSEVASKTEVATFAKARNMALPVPIKNLSPVRSCNNLKGSGKVMSVELVDAGGTHIRACAFNKNAESVALTMELDKVYCVRGAAVRCAKQQYTSVQHPFEILLSDDTTIETVDDDAISYPKYDFKGIRELAPIAESSVVDVVGVPVKVEEIDYVKGKNGKLTKKRELTFVDTSNVSILLTLWNEFADIASGTLLGKEIAVRHCRVSTYHARSISTGTGSMIAVEPKLLECEELHRWFGETQGADAIPIEVLACKFVSVSEVLQSPRDAPVNVIGFIQRVGPVVDVQSNDGRELRKRDIVVEDSSNSITCTLWQFATDCVNEANTHHVIAVHNGSVVDFNGRGIGTRTNSSVAIDPDIPERYRLTSWCEDASVEEEKKKKRDSWSLRRNYPYLERSRK